MLQMVVVWLDWTSELIDEQSQQALDRTSHPILLILFFPRLSSKWFDFLVRCNAIAISSASLSFSPFSTRLMNSFI